MDKILLRMCTAEAPVRLTVDVKVVTPCNVAVGHRRFEVPSYLHRQGEDGEHIFMAVRTSNLTRLTLLHNF
jgi:hypothetical protein